MPRGRRTMSRGRGGRGGGKGIAGPTTSPSGGGDLPADAEVGFAKLQGEDFEYYMQTYSILLGRSSKRVEVDVDLTSLGGGKNISRRHARIFYDFRRRRFALEVLGKNGCMVEGVHHYPGTPPVKLDSQDLLQMGNKQFYFLLPSRALFGNVPRSAIPLPPPPAAPRAPDGYGGAALRRGGGDEEMDGGDEEEEEEEEEDDEEERTNDDDEEERTHDDDEGERTKDDEEEGGRYEEEEKGGGDEETQDEEEEEEDAEEEEDEDAEEEEEEDTVPRRVVAGGGGAGKTLRMDQGAGWGRGGKSVASGHLGRSQNFSSFFFCISFLIITVLVLLFGSLLIMQGLIR